MTGTTNSSILGKRKFGAIKSEDWKFLSLEEREEAKENEMAIPAFKKIKHRTLPLKADLAGNTQQISEKVFGAGTKSVMKIDLNQENSNNININENINENENENGNTENNPENQEKTVFQMIKFPKHRSIKDVNDPTHLFDV